MKTSYVYFITDNHGHMKIGKADEPVSRLKTLQIGNAYTLDIYETIEVEEYKSLCFDATRFEAFLHEKFSECRIRDEWFTDEPIKKWLEEIRHDVVSHPKSKYSSACFSIPVFRMPKRMADTELFHIRNVNHRVHKAAVKLCIGLYL